ncbi:MAG: aldehyde dehydrogenase, partial [bacterium]
MPFDEQKIEEIVNQVLAQLGKQKEFSTSIPKEEKKQVISEFKAPQVVTRTLVPESLDDIIDESRKAFIAYRKLGLEARAKIIRAIRDICYKHSEELGRLAVEETGLGKMPDKMLKIQLAVNKTPGIEDLVPRSFTGDHGLTLEELAPYGVIGSITPSTNPAETIVNNTISMIAGGNSVVFCPHPAAKRVSTRTVELIQKAIVECGGPPNLVQNLKEPSQELARNIMHHPGIDLLVVTGGGAVVDLAMKSGKKAICAGPGNPPVVVDETAIIEKAGADIVEGASFDNNVLCVAEKEVFVVESVAEKLKRVMREHGAFEVSGSVVERLTHMVIAD